MSMGTIVSGNTIPLIQNQASGNLPPNAKAAKNPPMAAEQSHNSTIPTPVLSSSKPTPAPASSKLTLLVPVIASSNDSNAPQIDVETNLQLRLVTMSGIMDDDAADVFEQSCDTFLGSYLADYEIFDVECDITDQELELIRRRRLSTESSLLVDVKVEGSTNATSSVDEQSDIAFDEMLFGIFEVYSDEFVDRLKADVNGTNIDDFENLTSMHVVELETGATSSSSSYLSTGDKTDAKDEEKSKNGGIAAIVISGVAVLTMFGAYFYHVSKRRKSSDRYDHEVGSVASDFDVDNFFQLTCSGTNEEGVEVSIPSTSSNISSAEASGDRHKTKHSSSSSMSSSRQYCGISTSIDESRDDDDSSQNISYLYSLDDGLATPRSFFSPSPRSSPTNQLQHQISQWTDSSAKPNRITKEIDAPPGKLGIFIDQSAEGPFIHSLKRKSALNGVLFEGDLIVAVDGQDTREWGAEKLTHYVATKSRYERKITIMRSVLATVSESHSESLDDSDGERSEIYKLPE
jgi:hypothetical protein